MRRATILAVGALLFVPGMAEAEGRPASVIEADIATVDGRIMQVQKTIEEGGRADARMQTALEECDRLDAIYAGYRKRLVAAQEAVNAAHRAYKEQFRLASVMGPCNAQTLWWQFCNLPHVEDLVGWKTCGPYKKSLQKTHAEFIAARTAFQAEKRAVATELPRNTELLSLGLGAFDDYFAFKRAYLERKADCDGTVRPYFRDRKSFVELQGELEELKRRRAQLQEELAATRGGRQPMPVTEGGEERDARLVVLFPKAAGLADLPLQHQLWGVKGFVLGIEVADGGEVLEIGRLYKLVVQLKQRTFTVYGRAQAPGEVGAAPILRFQGVIPARLGPFQLRLSVPDEPRIREASVRGRLVPPSGEEEDLAEAQKDLARAQRPRPHSDPEAIQRDLCQAHGDAALALMRLDRIDESMRAALQAQAILKRHWPASRAWRRMRGSIWYRLSWVFAQEALARGDVGAVEKIYLARADIYREVIAADRQRGSETNAKMRFGELRGTYRRLGDLVVLLTGDLDRARNHWRTGRALLHPDEQDAPEKPGFDPVWFAP
jgi:hypothetical protein